MGVAALIEALGRHLSAVLAFGLAAFAVAEAFRPHAAFADEPARVRHMAVNAGVWLAGFVLVELWLVPWVRVRFPYEPADAWVTLAGWPVWAQLVVGLLALDLADWTLHWLSHRVRPLWMLHAVHHSDPHVDVTTTLRHHPLGIIVGLAWQVALLALDLGARCVDHDLDVVARVARHRVVPPLRDLDRRRHPVGHVEEGGHRADVPDVAIGEADVA